MWRLYVMKRTTMLAVLGWRTGTQVAETPSILQDLELIMGRLRM